MSGKKVSFGAKPQLTQVPLTPDSWVSGEEVSAEPETPVAAKPTEASSKGLMKRLTIDIPESLHKRVKSGCALRGEKIADVVRDLLEQRFAEES